MKKLNALFVMFKEAGILFLITLIAGLSLGFVYEVTTEARAYQQVLKIQRTCKEAFAGRYYKRNGRWKLYAKITINKSRGCKDDLCSFQGHSGNSIAGR